MRQIEVQDGTRLESGEACLIHQVKFGVKFVAKKCKEYPKNKKMRIRMSIRSLANELDTILGGPLEDD